MVKKKASRSSYDGKPWKCRCGCVNKPTKHKFFNVPAFKCGNCTRKLTLDFSFCLGDIEAEGKSVIGEVRDQEFQPFCVPFAYAKAAEITERAYYIKNGRDPDKVNPFNPSHLELRFHEKFTDLPSADSLTVNAGLHKVVHMGLILRSEGIRRNESDEKYIAADVSTIPRDAFEQISQSIAEGVPFVATYLAGKRRGKLPYCKTYKSARQKQYRKKKAARAGHAVVLIGAGMKGRKIFHFLNSWGKKICPRKNKSGEIVAGGIGKLRMKDLTKNVVKLSPPNETGGERSLQDQTMMNISSLNYVLMMAPQHQCYPERLLKMRENDTAGEIQADILDYEVLEDDFATNLRTYSVITQDHPNLSQPQLNDNQMQTIFGSGVATGRFAMGSNQPLGDQPSSDPIDLDGEAPAQSNGTENNEKKTKPVSAGKRKRSCQDEWNNSLMTNLTDAIPGYAAATNSANAPSHASGMQSHKHLKMIHQKAHGYVIHPSAELDEKDWMVPKVIAAAASQQFFNKASQQVIPAASKTCAEKGSQTSHVTKRTVVGENCTEQVMETEDLLKYL